MKQKRSTIPCNSYRISKMNCHSTTFITSLTTDHPSALWRGTASDSPSLSLGFALFLTLPSSHPSYFPTHLIFRPCSDTRSTKAVSRLGQFGEGFNARFLRFPFVDGLNFIIGSNACDEGLLRLFIYPQLSNVNTQTKQQTVSTYIVSHAIKGYIQLTVIIKTAYINEICHFRYYSQQVNCHDGFSINLFYRFSSTVDCNRSCFLNGVNFSEVTVWR